jgi:hypothetical protein
MACYANNPFETATSTAFIDLPISPDIKVLTEGKYSAVLSIALGSRMRRLNERIRELCAKPVADASRCSTDSPSWNPKPQRKQELPCCMRR